MATRRDLFMTADLPPGEVFDTLLEHVQQEKYDIQALSNETRQIAFSTARTLVTSGYIYLARVEGTESGAQLKVTVDNTSGDGLLDGKLNERRGAKLLRALAAAVESDAAPAPTAIASFIRQEDGTTAPWISGRVEELKLSI